MLFTGICVTSALALAVRPFLNCKVGSLGLGERICWQPMNNLFAFPLAFYLLWVLLVGRLFALFVNPASPSPCILMEFKCHHVCSARTMASAMQDVHIRIVLEDDATLTPDITVRAKIGLLFAFFVT